MDLCERGAGLFILHEKGFPHLFIELAACADLLDKEKEKEFFADCKRHFEHIRQTVTETFRTPGYELDKTDAVLELPIYVKHWGCKDVWTICSAICLPL